MTTTLTWLPADQSRIAQFFRDAHHGSPRLWISSWTMIAFFVVCSLLPLIDGRMLIGVSVWEKPAKFFLSLAVQGLTVAWALSLTPVTARGVRTAVNVLILASWAELIYIVARAFRGEASHFNVGTPLDAALYAMMGIGSVSILAASAFIGYRLWQNRRSGLWPETTGLGLMLGAFLATLTAGYMSSGTGHWVGGDLTDATGLPFFHWSTTGGDLRVAHFIGLHATQLVPFAVLSGNRWVAYGTAGFTVVLTAATFAQAVLGIPLLAS